MKDPQKHIPFEQLADLAEERTPAEERGALLQHIAACPRCEGELMPLQQLIMTMRTDTAVDAPRDVIAHARNVFRHGASLKSASLVRRIVAALTFDSLTSAPAFGMRSGQAGTRQLLFSAEGNDIDLRISAQADGWVISGQVLGATSKSADALLQGDAHSTMAVLNDLSEFSFAPVPPGNYKLNVRLGDVEVEVQQLELGE